MFGKYHSIKILILLFMLSFFSILLPQLSACSKSECSYDADCEGNRFVKMESASIALPKKVVN